jgi:DGQHR domain-containing protein
MTSTKLLHYDVVVPVQAANMPVFTFAAKAADIAKIARIERAGRDETGALQGFQRPQIAGHIREIRDYLEKPNAILPNPIVVAFTGAAVLEVWDGSLGRLTIDVSAGPPGWIVDGQQRFTALSETRSKDFEILVSGFICADMAELQRQFILINNTRPLPKALVYELLPKVSDLPHRMSSRSQAALMVEALNYRTESSLRGLIKQQTNPTGIIKDTILQKFILNSLSDGALRMYSQEDSVLLEKGSRIVSEFFHAVREVFREDWDGKTPKTSRLLHGTGIIALGYVMETLASSTGAKERHEFAEGLSALKGKTAWSAGEWNFSDETRRWNGLQNVATDMRQLSFYLVNEVNRSVREGKFINRKSEA